MSVTMETSVHVCNYSDITNINSSHSSLTLEPVIHASIIVLLFSGEIIVVLKTSLTSIIIFIQSKIFVVIIVQVQCYNFTA